MSAPKLPAGDHRRLERVILAALVAALLVVRVALALTVEMPIVADSAGYDVSAIKLVRTGSYAYPIQLHDSATGAIPLEKREAFLDHTPNAYTVPGYSAFLAAIYAVVGTGEGREVAVAVVQAFVSVLLLPLVYMIGRRMRDGTTGLLAAIGCAFYLPFTWVVTYMLTETLYTVLTAAAVLAVMVTLERRTLLWALLTGVLFGFGVMVRPVALLWPLAVAAYMFAERGFGWRRALSLLGLAGAGLALLIVPWTVRNQFVYGHFVPLTTSSANALAASTSERYEAGGPPRALYPDTLGEDDYAINRYWAEQGKQRLKERLTERPWQFFAFRARVAFNGTVMLTWPDKAPAIEGRPNLLRAQRGYHLLVVALWLAGTVMALVKRDRTVLLVSSVVFYFVLVHAATLMLSRYMHPAVPYEILVGAWCLATGRAALVRRTARGDGGS